METGPPASHQALASPPPSPPQHRQPPCLGGNAAQDPPSKPPGPSPTSEDYAHRGPGTAPSPAAAVAARIGTLHEDYAVAAAPPSSQLWTTVQRKKATRANPSKPAWPVMDLWRFIMVSDHSTPSPPLPNLDMASVQSTSRALHQKGAPTNVRLDSLRLSGKASYVCVGTAISSSSVEMLFPFRDSVIKAARLAGPGIAGL